MSQLVLHYYNIEGLKLTDLLKLHKFLNNKVTIT